MFWFITARYITPPNSGYYSRGKAFTFVVTAIQRFCCVRTNDGVLAVSTSCGECLRWRCGMLAGSGCSLRAIILASSLCIILPVLDHSFAPPRFAPS